MRQSVAERALQDVKVGSSAISDRSADVRVSVTWWVEGNGAHVHITVSMGLAVLVEFSVKVRVRGGKG